MAGVNHADPVPRHGDRQYALSLFSWEVINLGIELEPFPGGPPLGTKEVMFTKIVLKGWWKGERIEDATYTLELDPLPKENMVRLPHAADLVTRDFIYHTIFDQRLKDVGSFDTIVFKKKNKPKGFMDRPFDAVGDADF